MKLFYSNYFLISNLWISVITKTIFSLTVQSSSCFISFHIKNGYSLRAHTIIPGKLLIKEIVFSLKLGKSFVFYFFSFEPTGDALGTICNITYFLGSSWHVRIFLVYDVNDWGFFEKCLFFSYKKVFTTYLIAWDFIKHLKIKRNAIKTWRFPWRDSKCTAKV